MEDIAEFGLSEHEVLSQTNMEHEKEEMHNVFSLNAGQDDEGSSKIGGGRGNAHPKGGKQSYTSLFKDNRMPVEASLLHYISPPVGEVVIGMEEIDSMEKTRGYCLVGYVMGPRSSPYDVLNFVKGWGRGAKFVFMDHGWIKFQFANELY